MEDNKRTTQEATDIISSHLDRVTKLVQFSKSLGWTDDEFNRAIADLYAKFGWHYQEYYRPR